MWSALPIFRELRRSTCMAVTLCLAGGSASAADLDASVAFATNYVVHGLSRSWNQGALQGHVALVGERGWSVGIWSSSVELYPGGPDTEVDYYLASRWAPSRDWVLHTRVTRYEFQGPTAFSYNYTEIAAGASFRERLTATVAYSPDHSFYSSEGAGLDEPALALEASVRQPLTRRLHLMAGVGQRRLGAPVDGAYWYWSGGGEVAWRRVSLNLSYLGADRRADRLFYGLVPEDAWVATLAFRVH
jgi:uncharacterized protein (TIGR02001 family)